MLKVFLVEDEVVVREGIKKKINWEEYGFTFVGEAADGELAYSAIQAAKPDVVITDIKMPFMDGLQLSRLLHKDMPWVKIIILTGHDDFKYAQEAIGIGVADYLLKPVSRRQIIETILRVKGLVEAEQEQKSYHELYLHQMQEKQRHEEHRFFEKLVSRDIETPELLSLAKELGISISGTDYTVVQFRFYSPQHQDSYSEATVQLVAALEEAFPPDGPALLFNRGIEGYTLLVKGTGEADSQQLAGRAVETLESLFAGHPNLQHYIGVGKQVARIAEIRDSYETASRAFAHQYLLGSGGAVMFRDMAGGPAAGEDISLASLDVGALDQRVVERFLAAGGREDAPYLVEDLFQSIGEEHIKSLMLRQYVAMQVYFAALAFTEKLGADKQSFIEACGDINRLGEELGTVEGTKAYLARVLVQALGQRDEKSQRRHGALLQKAQEYIDENYAQEEISLNEVARVVNVSPTHFSATFSQEMGRTFIEYLTAKRMEKAKELLRCTSKKSSEIAYEVGYKDPHYFSFLFKKMQGVSPREFRAEGRDEE